MEKMLVTIKHNYKSSIYRQLLMNLRFSYTCSIFEYFALSLLPTKPPLSPIILGGQTEKKEIPRSSMRARVLDGFTITYIYIQQRQQYTSGADARVRAPRRPHNPSIHHHTNNKHREYRYI